MNNYNRKFFKEIKNKPHLDIRYGKDNLSKNSIHSQLKMLLSETVHIFNTVHIPCIIMHGSLIGWYFGQKMLPWDDDIDIVILDEHREKIKTLHGYQNNKILIEVNPVIDTIHRDPSNIIEARIICKNTGVFIDVTNLSKGNIFRIGPSKTNVITKTFTLNKQYITSDTFLFKPLCYRYIDQFDIRYSLLTENKLQISVKRIDMNKGWGLDLCLYGYDSDLNSLYNKNMINCFSPHYYPITDIYPLKQTTFENINVYIPNNVENTLISEYGNNVLKPYYKQYVYKDGKWVNKL
mgnify:CR=1 FL=1